jgi:putative ABC transport system ATP-binding protein
MGRPWSALGGAARDRLRADHVGYIFQQFNLLPYLSVLDNVRLPCRFSARRAQRAGDPTAQAQALLEQVGLPRDHWRRRADELSVGQQQRVAAARALIGTPELVIADEPTSSLDATLRDSFMAVLLAQCRAAGSTLVFVSHDERLAAAFDRRLSLPALNRAVQAGGGT